VNNPLFGKKHASWNFRKNYEPSKKETTVVILTSAEILNRTVSKRNADPSLTHDTAVLEVLNEAIGAAHNAGWRLGWEEGFADGYQSSTKQPSEQ
jgi:hypothetical protein